MINYKSVDINISVSFKDTVEVLPRIDVGAWYKKVYPFLVITMYVSCIYGYN